MSPGPAGVPYSLHHPQRMPIKTVLPHLLLLGWLLFGLPMRCGATSPANRSEIPELARQTIDKEALGSSVDEISKSVDKAETVYNVTATKDGKQWSFSVEPDGTLHEPVELADIPELIQKTIRREVRDGTIDAIDKTSDHGEFFYDIDATVDGKSWTFSVSSDGTIDRELELADTPEVVKEAIMKEVGGGKITAIDRTSENDETFYDVEFIKDGQQRSFSVSSDGTLCEILENGEKGGGVDPGLSKWLIPGAAVLVGAVMIFWFRKRRAN